MGTVHWWLPGTAPGCPATIRDRPEAMWTADPAEVGECRPCLLYLVARFTETWRPVGRDPRTGLGAQVTEPPTYGVPPTIPAGSMPTLDDGTPDLGAELPAGPSGSGTADVAAVIAAATSQSPASPPRKIYDSVEGANGGPIIPGSAQYVMLYADRQPPQKRWMVDQHVQVRWITERGNSAFFCLDYELGTPVYQQPGEVRRFFDARLTAHERGLLYCQRSLLSQVHSYVGPSIWTNPDFLLWLPTLDNRQWTPAEIVDDLARNWGVSIKEAQVWGNQYATSPDSGGPWDISNLFGTFD